MSLETNAFPSPENAGVLTLESVVSQFDLARLALFTASSNYMAFPTGGRERRLEETTQGLTDAFSDTAKFIVGFEEMDEIEKARSLVSLVVADDVERVSFFTGLHGEDNHFRGPAIDPEIMVANIAANIRSGYNDKLILELMSHYRSNLKTDMDTFLEVTEDTPNARALRIAKAVGKHSLDVAKITLGVMIGIKLAGPRKK